MQLSTSLVNALNQFEVLFRDSVANKIAENYYVLLQNLVPTIITETDKTAFIGCVNIAKSSIQYWQVNMDNWNALSNQLMGTAGRSRFEQTLIDMAYADASGALIGTLAGAGLLGATAGGILGSFIIPGLGTYVGTATGALAGMIGSALVGSTMSGIHSVVRWIIGW